MGASLDVVILFLDQDHVFMEEEIIRGIFLLVFYIYLGFLKIRVLLKVVAICR